MKVKRTKAWLTSIAVAGLLPSPAFADIVGFEAEAGSTPAGKDAYRVQNDENALGCQYIDTDHRDAKDPFGDFAVYREYSLALPAGTYDLWGRIYCPTLFTYDPDFSDDPDSNDALAAFESDSFFVPFTFGGDPAVDLDRGNGFASSGRFDGLGAPPRANVHDAYAWINLTDGVDLNGLGPSSGTVDPVASYTTAGGTVRFRLMSREGGIRHDGFAFVPDGQMPTEEELNAAVVVPEPVRAEISYDPGSGDLTMSWDSRSGMLYNLRSATGLATAPETWPIYGGHHDLEATPPQNTLVFPLPAEAVRFFVIEEFPVPPVTVLWEDFETGLGDWTTGQDDLLLETAWELGSPSIVGPVPPGIPLPSPINCIGTNLAADYGTDSRIWLRTAEIDLTSYQSATLRFQHYQDIETGFDFGSIHILKASDDSELAVVESTIDGATAGWEEFSRGLPTEAFTEAIKIEFRFSSDDFDFRAGWYLDDLEVTASLVKAAHCGPE